MSRSMSPYLESNYGSVPKKKPSGSRPKLKLVKKNSPKAQYSSYGYDPRTNQTNLPGQTAGEKWTGGISYSGGRTVIDVAKTLQNARSATHQSTQVRTIATRATDLVVDVGLKLEPMPDWEQLGITDDELKETWIRRRETAFDIYMHSKQCHRAEQLTGYQLQQLWQLASTRDNDQFGRLFYNNSKRLMSRVQLEIIDPTLIRGYAVVDSDGQHQWNNGIKRDAKNREVAYKITERTYVNGRLTSKQVEVSARGKRSNRVFMFHSFKPDYAGQTRGYSKLHPTLQDFHSLVDYIFAIVKKAINQGGIVGFVEPSDFAPASNPTEDQQGGPNQIPDNFTVTDDGKEFCYHRSEYKTREPGSDFFANLKPGEKIKFLQDTAPGPDFDSFITSIFKHASASLGWPLEVILMSFNSNYSASRAALLEAWRTSRILQADLKAGLMDIWYEMWLSEEIAAGRIQCPGWQDPRLKQAWMRYRLQGPTLPSISPRDDSAAFETQLKLNLTTQDRLARQVNGSDAAQNILINQKMFEKSPAPYWQDEPKPAETTPKSGEGSGD